MYLILEKLNANKFFVKILKLKNNIFKEIKVIFIPLEAAT